MQVPKPIISDTWSVRLIERERGSAPEVFNTYYFDNLPEAYDKYKEVNSKNDKKVTPDYYIYAEPPEKIDIK